jgi:hypothetical protein
VTIEERIFDHILSYVISECATVLRALHLGVTGFSVLLVFTIYLLFIMW